MTEKLLVNHDLVNFDIDLVREIKTSEEIKTTIKTKLN